MYTDKGCTSSGKIIQKYTYWVCGIGLQKKAYMANEILRMGVLDCFKELSKLAVKCCNSLIVVSLSTKKIKLANEIVQISAFNCFQRVALES